MPVYKDEKRGTWFVAYRYKDWTGKQRTTKKRGFATKREAQSFERQAIDSKDSSKGLTLRTLYNLYLSDMKARTREGTVLSFENIAEKHILPFFEHRKLQDITPSLIRKWENEAIIGGNFAKTTQITITSAMSRLMKFSVKYYGLDKNPVETAGLVGSMTETKRTHLVWSKDEFDKFVNAVGEKYRLYFYILFYTGIRRGEFSALRYSDIEGNIMHINKQKVRLRTGKWVIAPPKTKNSIRDITLPKFLVDMINLQRHRVVDNDMEIVPFSPQLPSLRYQLHKVCRDIGLNRITLHEFRHSHASLLISMGLPVTSIAKRLGHTPAMTLKVYAHAFDSMEEAVVTKLQNLYLNSPSSSQGNLVPPLQTTQQRLVSLPTYPCNEIHSG